MVGAFCPHFGETEKDRPPNRPHSEYFRALNDLISHVETFCGMVYIHDSNFVFFFWTPLLVKTTIPRIFILSTFENPGVLYQLSHREGEKCRKKGKKKGERRNVGRIGNFSGWGWCIIKERNEWRGGGGSMRTCIVFCGEMKGRVWVGSDACCAWRISEGEFRKR